VALIRVNANPKRVLLDKFLRLNRTTPLALMEIVNMTMKRIRLELARDHEFPNGSRERGYEFAAPIDGDGHIIVGEWRKERTRCRVKRFWSGEDTEVGHLLHKPGGGWAFHYDVHGAPDDDEAGYRFDHHAFRPGEYVSIKEHDGMLRTFRVISVRDLE
jgi:hypothetical protein